MTQIMEPKTQHPVGKKRERSEYYHQYRKRRRAIDGHLKQLRTPPHIKVEVKSLEKPDGVSANIWYDRRRRLKRKLKLEHYKKLGMIPGMEHFEPAAADDDNMNPEVERMETDDEDMDLNACDGAGAYSAAERESRDAFGTHAHDDSGAWHDSGVDGATDNDGMPSVAFANGMEENMPAFHQDGTEKPSSPPMPAFGPRWGCQTPIRGTSGATCGLNFGSSPSTFGSPYVRPAPTTPALDINNAIGPNTTPQNAEVFARLYQEERRAEREKEERMATAEREKEERMATAERESRERLAVVSSFDRGLEALNASFHQGHAAFLAAASPSRNTFASASPSRATFAAASPSRNTFAAASPSRDTFAAASPSRDTFAAASPSPAASLRNPRAAASPWNPSAAGSSAQNPQHHPRAATGPSQNPHAITSPVKQNPRNLFYNNHGPPSPSDGVSSSMKRSRSTSTPPTMPPSKRHASSGILTTPSTSASNRSIPSGASNRSFASGRPPRPRDPLAQRKTEPTAQMLWDRVVKPKLQQLLASLPNTLEDRKKILRNHTHKIVQKMQERGIEVPTTSLTESLIEFVLGRSKVKAKSKLLQQWLRDYSAVTKLESRIMCLKKIKGLPQNLLVTNPSVPLNSETLHYNEADLTFYYMDSNSEESDSSTHLNHVRMEILEPLGFNQHVNLDFSMPDGVTGFRVFGATEEGIGKTTAYLVKAHMQKSAVQEVSITSTMHEKPKDGSSLPRLPFRGISELFVGCTPAQKIELSGFYIPAGTSFDCNASLSLNLIEFEDISNNFTVLEGQKPLKVILGEKFDLPVETVVGLAQSGSISSVYFSDLCLDDKEALEALLIGIKQSNVDVQIDQITTRYIKNLNNLLSIREQEHKATNPGTEEYESLHHKRWFLTTKIDAAKQDLNNILGQYGLKGEDTTDEGGVEEKSDDTKVKDLKELDEEESAKNWNVFCAKNSSKPACPTCFTPFLEGTSTCRACSATAQASTAETSTHSFQFGWKPSTAATTEGTGSSLVQGDSPNVEFLTGSRGTAPTSALGVTKMAPLFAGPFFAIQPTHTEPNRSSSRPTNMAPVFHNAAQNRTAPRTTTANAQVKSVVPNPFSFGAPPVEATKAEPQTTPAVNANAKIAPKNTFPLGTTSVVTVSKAASQTAADTPTTNAGQEPPTFGAPSIEEMTATEPRVGDRVQIHSDYRVLDLRNKFGTIIDKVNATLYKIGVQDENGEVFEKTLRVQSFDVVVASNFVDANS